MISWKHSFNRLNEEYEIAKKKKQALDNLYENGRISQSTHESFDKELSAGIAEIERQQHALLDKMGQKTTDLENQVKTLEMLLTNYEIQHVAGEIDEEIYQLEINLLSNGLATIKGELESIRDAANRICAPIVPEFEAQTLPETEVEAAPTQTETPEVAVEATPTEFNVATEPTVPEVEAEPSYETPQAEETEPQPEETPAFEAQATEPSETLQNQSSVQETAYYETPTEVADNPEPEFHSDESTNLEAETAESTEIVDNVEEQTPAETPVFEANIDETNVNPEIETSNENDSTEEQQTEDVPTYEAQAQEDNLENATEQAPEESNGNVFEEGAIEENVEQLNIDNANIQENVEQPNTEETAEIEIITKEAVEIVQGENPEDPIENAEMSQDSYAEEQSDLTENATIEDENNQENSEDMAESNIEEPQMENADFQTDAIEEVAMGENNMEDASGENMDMPETQSFQIESAPAVKEIETQDPLEAPAEATTERNGEENDATPEVSAETQQDTMATSGDESTSDIEPTSDERENSE